MINLAKVKNWIKTQKIKI